MATEIYLGEPPQHIKDWIIAHSRPPAPVEPDTQWKSMVLALESGQYDDSNPMALDGVSLAPGSALSGVNYVVEDGQDPVPTTWIVLGYNKEIPEYVKYKNGDERIWVKSNTGVNGQLAPIVAGAVVYTRSWDETTNEESWAESGTVAGVGSSTFAYGNNCTYDVPTTLTVNDKEYAFAGYNMTIQSEALLGVKLSQAEQDAASEIIAGMSDVQESDVTGLKNCFVYKSHDAEHEYGRSDWKSSDVRRFLNDSSPYADVQVGYYDSDYWYPIKASAATLFQRLAAEDGLLRNAQKTVSRVWTHGDLRDGTEDANGCQHLADRFVLLGCRELNGVNMQDTYPGMAYETSKFDGVWAEGNWYSEDWIKYWMNEDGTTGSSSACWWLRSAVADDSYRAAHVRSDGYVYYYDAYDYLCLSPACTIG